MSLVLCLRQRSAAHLLADAAVYKNDGELVAINAAKCIAMPTLHAAVACVGPAALTGALSRYLPFVFDTFDELVEHGEKYLPYIFKKVVAECGPEAQSTCAYFIGWRKSAGQAEAYCCEMYGDDPSRGEELLENSSVALEELVARAFKMIGQTGLTGTPIPPLALIREAGFRVRGNENDYVPARDLRHLAEIARQEPIGGKYWIGGKAILTTIDRDGVHQRELVQWAEDRVGQPINPLPLDWKTFRVVGQSRKSAFTVVQ